MDALFAKFAAFYGHIWRTQFKSDGFLEFAKKEWQEGLKEFSDVIFNKAIIECREFYELPPTLPQMIDCCRQIKRRNNFCVVSTSNIPAKKEVVIAHLKQCKDILTKK